MISHAWLSVSRCDVVIPLAFNVDVSELIVFLLVHLPNAVLWPDCSPRYIAL